jgi:DNA repair protein RecN (Recombination protein N)
MLEQLQIRNLATIEELALELEPGFTALSGETGAGKSILIDALGLVLGTRADPALIRGGSERADITATFRIAPKSAAAHWLAEQALVDEDDAAQCVVRRVLQNEGRTRAYINGTAVAASQLRDLGERLVDVYGQNESHSLRLPDVQRELLDSYGGHADALAAVAARTAEWLALDDQIERLRQAASRDPIQVDLLRHQVRELEALAPKVGEAEEIAAEHRRLANGGRLLQDGGAVQEQLYGGDGAVHDQLSASLGTLRGLVALHPDFGDAETLVASAQAQIREAADGLRRLLGRLDLDPQRLAEIEARIGEMHTLARKHRVRAEELPGHLAAMKAELEEAEAAGGRIGELLAQQADALDAYRQAAQTLSQARRAAAVPYGKAVSSRVRELGMPNAKFEVRIEPASRKRPSAHGDDDLCFDFSANPGQAPRPLAKVASGGELSRVSLALQVVAQQDGGAPTMIFDEVDAGIGGGVAEAVGRQLRALGDKRQVLCVTHLGQVAACAAHHLAVSKRVKSGQTFTSVDALDGKARVAELARMVGGQSTTAASEAMARELLKAGAAKR